jgi:hypothetical protein
MDAAVAALILSPPGSVNTGRLTTCSAASRCAHEAHVSAAWMLCTTTPCDWVVVGAYVHLRASIPVVEFSCTARQPRLCAEVPRSGATHLGACNYVQIDTKLFQARTTGCDQWCLSAWQSWQYQAPATAQPHLPRHTRPTPSIVGRPRKCGSVGDRLCAADTGLLWLLPGCCRCPA